MPYLAWFTGIVFAGALFALALRQDRKAGR